MRYVAFFVAGAPLMVTEDLIKTFNISLVVRGTVSECHHTDGKELKRYAYPKSKDIFRFALH
jgi:ethanolamine-phosphate cytidylyltransferase